VIGIIDGFIIDTNVQKRRNLRTKSNKRGNNSVQEASLARKRWKQFEAFSA